MFLLLFIAIPTLIIGLLFILLKKLEDKDKLKLKKNTKNIYKKGYQWFLKGVPELEKLSFERCYQYMELLGNFNTLEQKKELSKERYFISLYLFICLFLSVSVGLRFGGLFFIAWVFLFFTYLLYHKTDYFLRNKIYTLLVFSFWEVGVVFGFSGYLVRTYSKFLFFHDSPFLQVLVCIFPSLFLAFVQMRLEILKEFVHLKIIKKEEKKLPLRLHSFLTRTRNFGLVAIILGTQFFRINKLWIKEDIFSGELYVNSPLEALFIQVILLLTLLVVSLLPTFLIDSSKVVEGYFFQKYPEEFRKELACTKEEWYGEDEV